MTTLHRPTFFESWRDATPDERAEHIFVLTLLGAIFLIMAVSAAVIGWLISLVGFPRLGIGIAVAMIVVGTVRLLGR